MPVDDIKSLIENEVYKQIKRHEKDDEEKFKVINDQIKKINEEYMKFVIDTTDRAARQEEREVALLKELEKININIEKLIVYNKQLESKNNNLEQKIRLNDERTAINTKNRINFNAKITAIITGSILIFLQMVINAFKG